MIEFLTSLGSGETLLTLYVLIFSIFLGYALIDKMPKLLHTPLMSFTNAISGIVILGAIESIHQASSLPEKILSTVALIFAATNVFGGFAVTDRMLKMFKK